MFRITAETCRAFTLAEALILAAMNVETMHVASAGHPGRATRFADWASRKRSIRTSQFRLFGLIQWDEKRS